MITKMKKLTFLIYHKEYETFLEQIRALGVIHIVERQRGELDNTLQGFLQKRNLYKNTLMNMYNRAEKQPDNAITREIPADEIVQEYEDLQTRIQELNQRLSVIDKEMAQMEIWGDFDWNAVERLKNSGWYIQFYTCSEKEFNEDWVDRYQVVRIHESAGHIYFVTVTPQSVDLELEPLRLPAFSLSELGRQREELLKELADTNAALTAFSKANYRALEKGSLKLEGEMELWKVKLNSERMADGAVLLLEGWIPEDKEADVKKLLEQSGIYYEVRAARKEDNAPIKLRNNAFTRMYEVLTKMYGMPDYAEFDPTPILAPFFSLFFAFCMGDAGYGLVLIALGFFLKRKLSKSLSGMMNLVMTLGVFTTVIGAVLALSSE